MDVYIAIAVLAGLGVGQMILGETPAWQTVEKATTPVAVAILLMMTLKLRMRLRDQTDQISYELRRLHERLDADAMDHLDSRVAALDPKLQLLAGPHVKRLAANLRSLFETHTFRIRDAARFTPFYESVLREYPDSHFMATALPSPNYFWGISKNNTLVKNFIAKGGRMTRVFWIEDEADLQSAEVREVLDDQRAIGVEVMTCLCKGAPKDLRRKLFAVDVARSIGWVVEVDDAQRVIGFDVTANRAGLANLGDEYTEIIHLPGTHPYEG